MPVMTYREALRSAMADEMERDESVVILNRYPYNNGHLLVAPLVHKGRFDELTDPERLDMSQQIEKYVGLIERLMHAEAHHLTRGLVKESDAAAA